MGIEKQDLSPPISHMKRNKPKQQKSSVRDRVKDLRRVRAGDLHVNPDNWRIHPEAQEEALRGVLTEVGYADAVIARELPGGALELLDGHLRAGLDPDQLIPVLVVDVDDAEAAKLLATLDPLAAMAEADPAKLTELLREIDTGSEALQTMLSELAESAGVIPKDERATRRKSKSFSLHFDADEIPALRRFLGVRTLPEELGKAIHDRIVLLVTDGLGRARRKKDH
jgi:hypothetical protein